MTEPTEPPRPAHAKLIAVPTIDGRDSCWGCLFTEQFICTRFQDCLSMCTSGANRIWIDESQLHDYIATKLVS